MSLAAKEQVKRLEEELTVRTERIDDVALLIAASQII